MKKIKKKKYSSYSRNFNFTCSVVYVRSRISPFFGNYSVEKNEKKG